MNPLHHHDHTQPHPHRRRLADKQFQTNFALLCTSCALLLLLVLTICFSEWRTMTPMTALDDSQPSAFHRRLEQEQQQQQEEITDYSSYRCDQIFTTTTTRQQQCAYATTCESTGLLLPLVFCSLSPPLWILLLFLPLLLVLTLLFRLLGSTADEYFSPSLEMFSTQMGLPPRFAGVTLLALGNGAADVSATINAIASDPENGYRMSLGALTGAAMFITTCIVGAVVVVNGGVRCRGAAVRDVLALGITLCVVGGSLAGGQVDRRTEKTFVSIYILFVLIVLIADIYHRAIMLPRLKHQIEMRERERQLEAERIAAARAAEALNAFATGSTTNDESNTIRAADGGSDTLRPSVMESSLSWAEQPTPLITSDDERTHASAPHRLEDPSHSSTSPIGNRALNAVLTALSNYNDEDNENGPEEDSHRPDGWGIESIVEGTKSWDRPIVLHGVDGILTRQHHHQPNPHADADVEGMDRYHSPYRVMEDLDAMDRVCIQQGSTGLPAYNWRGAWYDSRQELMAHLKECWRDIVEDEESGLGEKFLLICEFPMTLCRKFTIAIPCEGSYCRPLIALSLAVSPLWLGFYFQMQFQINLWDVRMAVFVSVMTILGILVIRYAPSGDGTMASYFSVSLRLVHALLLLSDLAALASYLSLSSRASEVPIALYGFVVAATWIDSLADKLVDVLDFLGIVLRIPNSIMGLTVLAWGNSMADLSANVTMARKGLANMAITACFAGPVFNILVGLGAGFSVLRSVTKEEIKYVQLTPSITTGFVFCFVNCVLLLTTGLLFNKGTITAGYGYFAVSLYALYIATSFVLQFLFNDQ
eukprot:CCRYP_006035-RA/>CCRYP_006035-RA protein AED:0.08 eAED:0.10 QI:0/0.8/0.66/1/0.8/0.66/6/287/819